MTPLDPAFVAALAATPFLFAMAPGSALTFVDPRKFLVALPVRERTPR